MSSFFASDHHIDHAKILTFKQDDGSMLRDFSNLEEMQETIIERHNALVHPKDRVYFLGDVAMKWRGLEILKRMNGRKVLLKGNHDIEQLKKYIPYFEDVRAYKIFPREKIVVSHIPIHPQSLERWKLNAHGHLHGNLITKRKFLFFKEPDPRYLNLSMEQINYTPVSLDYLIDYAKNL